MSWRSERSRHGGVDRVEVPGLPGHLWLCGKHFIGPDHVGAISRVGADVVVCLNEEHELVDRYPDYVTWLRSGDPSVRWRPVPDLSAPTVDDAIALVDEVVADLRSQRTVLIHCGAGMGRAGTVAAAVLVRHGHTPAQAVAVVAASRPLAGPEAGAQEALLAALHARWR